MLLPLRPDLPIPWCSPLSACPLNPAATPAWLTDHVCDTALFHASDGSMVTSQQRSTTMSIETKQIRRDMAFDTAINRILMSIVALYAVGCTAITTIHLYGL